MAMTSGQIGTVHDLYPMRRPSGLGDPGGDADDETGDASTGITDDGSGDTIVGNYGSDNTTTPGTTTTQTYGSTVEEATGATVGGQPAGTAFTSTPTVTPYTPSTPTTPATPTASIQGSAWKYILAAVAIVGVTGAVVWFATNGHKGTSRRRRSSARRRARRRA